MGILGQDLRHGLRTPARSRGFAAAVCLGSAMLFGLLAALRSSGIQPAAFLKERAFGNTSRLRIGKCMVSIQAALASVASIPPR